MTSAMRRFSVIGRARISACRARASLVPEASVIAAMMSPSTGAAIGGGGMIGKCRRVGAGVARRSESGQARVHVRTAGGGFGCIRRSRQGEENPDEHDVHRRRSDHSSRHRVGRTAVRPADVLSDAVEGTAGGKSVVAAADLH